MKCGSRLLKYYINKIGFGEEYKSVSRISLLSKAGLLSFYIQVTCSLKQIINIIYNIKIV